MSRSDTATENRQGPRNQAGDEGASAPQPAAGNAPSGLNAPTETTKVEYRAKRANLSMCMTPPENGKPGRFITFGNHRYATSDKKEIEFLDKLAKSDLMVAQEFFRLPDVDALQIDENIESRIDQMVLPELRSACRERGIDFQPVDDENALRYKLIKKLLLRVPAGMKVEPV